jgi:hypothetical protein
LSNRVYPNDRFVKRPSEKFEAKAAGQKCSEACLSFPFCEAGNSTSVERPLQIGSFMQNKPNFRKAEMNVSAVLTKDYRKNGAFAVQKNKPNSNPISERPKCS